MTLDIIVVGSFLLINLAFGLFSSRGITTVREYAIGNRNFSTATIAATIAATWLSGASFTITATEIYHNGLYFIIPGLGDAMSFFIVAYFYAPRMKEFLGKLSVADAMASMYNKHVRRVTVISGIFPAIGNVAMQFSILAALLNSWLDIPGIYAVAISSSIVIVYSTFGGIKSITFTDLIQFFTFGVVMPMVAFLMFSSLADTKTIFNALMQHPKFNYKAVFDYHNPDFLNILFLFLFFMIPGIDSAVFQRISMAKNTLQVSKSFIIAGCFVIICDLIVNTFIGVLLVADNTQVLDSATVVQYIVDHYLSTGFKGVFIMGIMAMIMSTADSYINSSAVLLAYDSVKAFDIKLSEQKQLLLVRIASFLIGISALSLSLYAKNLLDLILSTYSFYMPIVSVPFILAIFGFRSSARAVLIGMAAGFITVIYFKSFSGIDSLMPGMLANIIFFMSSHYILGESGGWIGIKDRTAIDSIRSERTIKIKLFVQSVKKFSLLRFCQNNTPKEEKIFVYFGLFCVITIFSNAYSLPTNLQTHYSNILEALYYSVLILSTIFITYPIWSEKFKSQAFISYLWVIAVFYNLAFSSSLLAVAANYNQMQVTILMASLITVAVLMRWQMALFIIVSSTFISIQSHKMYIGMSTLPDDMNSLQFKVTYSLLLVSSILIAFLKPKYEQHKLTEDKAAFLDVKLQDQATVLEKALKLKREFLANLEHEGHTPITGIVSIGEALWYNYDKLSDKQIRDGLETVAKSSDRLLSLVNNLIDVSKLSSMSYQLNKTEINLSELLYDRLDHCKRLYLDNQELAFFVEIQDNIKLQCDKHYLTSIFDSLIINSIKYGKKGSITIILKQYESTVEFSISDEGVGISKEELLSIFDPFTVGSRTRTKSGDIPNGQRGLGLALCKLAIDAHNGQIWAESDGEKGTVFRFTLPTDRKL